MENKNISREYYWNNGNLRSKLLTDKSTGIQWRFVDKGPDFEISRVESKAHSPSIDANPVKANAIVPAHLRLSIEFSLEKLRVKRICRIFPNTPAIRCHYELRGEAPGYWKSRAVGIQKFTMIEDTATRKHESENTMERLALAEKHWRIEAVRFKAATDYNNTLVQTDETELYRQSETLQGNLLFLEHKSSGQQIFMLKESPGIYDQFYYSGHDFRISNHNIRLQGFGVAPDDISADKWIKTYGFVTGVAGPGEYARLSALRQYQHNLRLLKPERDLMILMNTWGDRGKDGRIGEDFARREIDAGTRLGISHLQLDDGWQTGLSKNSASKRGALWEDWSKASWQPHPKRFPDGLKNTVALAKKSGMEIGIWFNPSSANSYQRWQRDAEILIDLYKKHGIRVFKIDGIELTNKQAEINLTSMFDKVVTATGGDIVFNLDVTAGRRFGYFYTNHYGNIFLENRYTDWANYYPYRTLRNLWMLSRYMPPQFLQIEFLNKWRNAEKYSTDDPLAPLQISFDYIFAVTMMAQPLAWFEASGLPNQAYSTASVIRRYRQQQKDIHQGMIFPIGEQPDGTHWTGFQSVNNDYGYLLVIREFNDIESASVKTWLSEGESVTFDHQAGSGKSFSAIVSDSGTVNFHLPEPHSFALYQYRIN